MIESTFQEFADLARRVSGQTFAPGKAYLIVARLQPIARREGFATLEDLAACLKARPNPVFENEIAAALVSKRTEFFRDRATLARIVSDVLPVAAETPARSKLRVWVAGGGPGQEAFSLVMLLNEARPVALEDIPIDILSTDLSKAATERARSGAFGHFEVQKGLSIHRLLANFTRQDDGQWRVNDELRRQISFRQHNLLEDMEGLGEFDVVLCRNVLGDMVESARAHVLKALSARLAPGGHVFFGDEETGVAGLGAGPLEASEIFQGGFKARRSSAVQAA
ncbi:MAG: protein-glutamate O-methyltransferase CheR [Pseudomonadota bacterium]